MNPWAAPLLVFVVGCNLLLVALLAGPPGCKRWLALLLGRRGVILLFAAELIMIAGGGVRLAVADNRLAGLVGIAWPLVLMAGAVGLRLLVVGVRGRPEDTDRVARSLLVPDVFPPWEPYRPPTTPPPVFAFTSHDRAFLAAVAAAPDDDTPRLVYADFLDETGDPRAPVLRAAVETPDVAAPLPAGVDPAWATAVRRPPHGVLIPGLTFADGGPPLDPAAVPADWPSDYRAFLLLHNGGRVSRPPAGVKRLTFFPLAEVVRAVTPLPWDWYEVDDELPYDNPLVVARADLGDDTGYLVLAGYGPARWLVELVRHADEPPVVSRFSRLPLDTFAGYLAGLADNGPGA